MIETNKLGPRRHFLGLLRNQSTWLQSQAGLNATAGRSMPRPTNKALFEERLSLFKVLDWREDPHGTGSTPPCLDFAMWPHTSELEEHSACSRATNKCSHAPRPEDDSTRLPDACVYLVGCQNKPGAGSGSK